jgi:hypothetical protein
MNRVSPDADRSKEEYILFLPADENDKFAQREFSATNRRGAAFHNLQE